MPVTSWFTSAGNNNAAPPNGAPEGCAPSDINNIMRQIMADVAVESQINAVKVLASVAGTNTITGSMTPDLTALSNGMMVIFKPFGANTGATTLNIDGLGAKSIVKANAAALVANDLITTQPAFCIYDAANNRYLLLNPQTALTASSVLASLLTVDGAGSTLDADLLDGIDSLGFARLAAASNFTTAPTINSVAVATSESGTFTATLNGFSSVITQTGVYTKVGAVVFCTLKQQGGTSNANTFTISGLPFTARVNGSGQAICGGQDISLTDNGAANYNQQWFITEGTSILKFRLNHFSTGFTASGTKGIDQGEFNFWYPV